MRVYFKYNFIFSNIKFYNKILMFIVSNSFNFISRKLLTRESCCCYLDYDLVLLMFFQKIPGSEKTSFMLKTVAALEISAASKTGTPAAALICCCVAGLICWNVTYWNE